MQQKCEENAICLTQEKSERHSVSCAPFSVTDVYANWKGQDLSLCVPDVQGVLTEENFRAEKHIRFHKLLLGFPLWYPTPEAVVFFHDKFLLLTLLSLVH